MSDWITDRLPTREDAHVDLSVWVCIEGGVLLWSYDGISLGTPWQPIGQPAPYVKPKRWTVEWNDCTWVLIDHRLERFYFVGLAELGPNAGDAAQRIEDLFNEELP
jgi:hypothetical protein